MKENWNFFSFTFTQRAITICPHNSISNLITQKSSCKIFPLVIWLSLFFLSLRSDGCNMMKYIAPLGTLASSVPVALHRAWCPFSQHLSSWTRRTSCTRRALSWRVPTTVCPVLHSPISRYQQTIFPIYIFARQHLLSLLTKSMLRRTILLMISSAKWLDSIIKSFSGQRFSVYGSVRSH